MLCERSERFVLRDRNHASIVMWSIGNEASTGPVTEAMMVSSRCRLARAARRSSCRSSLRLAAARRCSLVGTAVVLLFSRTRRQRVCQAFLSVGRATRANTGPPSGHGKLTGC